MRQQDEARTSRVGRVVTGCSGALRAPRPGPGRNQRPAPRTWRSHDLRFTRLACFAQAWLACSRISCRHRAPRVCSIVCLRAVQRGLRLRAHPRRAYAARMRVEHILFGNILLLQITLMLGKVEPRMQCACFVTKASVDAAPPGQITSSFMRSFFYFNVADSSSFA